MRRYGGLILAGVFLLAIRVAAEDPSSAIEFTGVLVADGKTRIALTDRTTGTTAWVETGAAFKGYAVTNYDAKESAVTVKKDGRELRLQLVAAKSFAAGADSMSVAAAPAPTPGGTPPVSPNANLVAAAVEVATAGTAPAAETPTLAPKPTVSAAFPPPTGVATVTPAQAAPLTPTGRAPAPAGAYVVQSGDTLARISIVTGVPMVQLQALNPGMNPGALQTGQTIRIR